MTSVAAQPSVIEKIGVKDKTDTDTDPKTSRDMWLVMIHASMGSCNMPFCRIPGISGIVCHCKKNGITPPSDGSRQSLRSRDGKCALTVTEFTEIITEAVPVLPRSKAYRVSCSLFESAMHNPVGTAMVIGTFKKAAEEYCNRDRKSVV